MCPESHPQYASIAGGIKTMSPDDLGIVRDRLEEVGGVKTMYLHCLGEPMLNQHTPSFVRSVRPLVERICLTTNGTVPMTRLLDCPPDYVRVSVYGQDQREFEEVTNRVLDHRKVLENVTALWQGRQNREQELPYIYVKGFGKFSTLHYRFGDVCDEVDVEPTMNWNGEGDWGGNVGPTKKRVCPAPFYMVTIHSDLRVSMCGVDWSKKLVVGNLREQNIRELWNSDAAHEIRLAHLRGNRCELDGCKTCSYIDTTLPDNLDELTVHEYEARSHRTAVQGKEVVYAG
jgi:radical SAM protein with 4Fe4S-binding SPASM domain